ncbi:MAG: hypothetical protein M3114_09465, partial [Thermoproteota archaeon]|nr:hypothetical protein [Thermoproteota archaeon]
ALPASPAIKVLTVEESRIHARKIFGETKGVNLIDEAMRKRGLVRGLERSKGYSVFSRKLLNQKAITIIPYSSPDPKSEFVGGLGLSDERPPSAVIVQLSGTRIFRFITLDIRDNELVEKEFDTSEFLKKPLFEFAREEAIVSNETISQPDLEVDNSIDVASNAMKVLVTDEHSSLIHSPEEIRDLLSNDGITRSIAEFQYLRKKRPPDSTGDGTYACCCCCCCCWGSCSSCAVATNNLNKRYTLIP